MPLADATLNPCSWDNSDILVLNQQRMQKHNLRQLALDELRMNLLISSVWGLKKKVILNVG